LKSIDVYLCYDMFQVDTIDMNEIEEEVYTVNTTMRSLILRDLGELDNVSYATCLLSIFKKCPMVEKVVVNFFNFSQNLFPVVAWCEMIANNWQHLQSLTLQYAVWMINNELIMNALENCCGTGLKELSIAGEMTNALIARICQSFVALESLELLFDDNTIIQYPVILQSFKQARFRNTLHTFKVPQVGSIDTTSHEKPFNYADILNCFPALHTVDLMITEDAMIQHEPFCLTSQVKEYSLRFNDCRLQTDDAMDMRSFCNLKKLSLKELLIKDNVLSNILTLPQLEHLIFHNVYRHDGTNCHSVFNLKYPSIQLAPLKEFSCTGNDGLLSTNGYSFQQEHIRIFLQRFVSLERLIIQKKAVKTRDLLNLRQEFRYQTVIITVDCKDIETD